MLSTPTIKDSKTQHVGRSDVGAARARLRSATADTHERLHRHPGFSGLLRGSLTMSQYSQLLARLYGFHRPLERALRMVPVSMRSGIDLLAREKAHLLHADLIAVGLAESAIDALPACKTLPEISSPAALVGCLYVIEGSGLGGSILAKKLDFLLGTEGTRRRRFFLGRTSPDPLPWGEFCGLLETCADDGNLNDLIEGARNTFDALELWLNQGGDDVSSGCHS
jgi:heme oxygenase